MVYAGLRTITAAAKNHCLKALRGTSVALPTPEWLRLIPTRIWTAAVCSSGGFLEGAFSVVLAEVIIIIVINIASSVRGVLAHRLSSLHRIVRNTKNHDETHCPFDRDLCGSQVRRRQKVCGTSRQAEVRLQSGVQDAEGRWQSGLRYGWTKLQELVQVKKTSL